MEDFVRIVKEKVRFREGTSKIEQILSLLYLNGNMSTKSISSSIYLPIPIVTAIKKELINVGIVVQESGIKLTQKGRKYVELNLGYAGLDISMYNEILNDIELQHIILQKLCSEYNHIFNQRPDADVTVDQAKATIETSFKRAMLCLQSESLLNKQILCVGDDDFTSVAIALLLKHIYSDLKHNKTQICVLDLDERIVSNINAISKEFKLPLNAVKIDFREALPISYANHFDVFFTDPPYTVDGLALFLSRGICALKKEKGLKVFLSFAHKPTNETLIIQEVINKHGLIVKKIEKGFNQYEGASLLGNNSQMIELESTDNLRTVVQMEEKFTNLIYTADFRNHVTRYQCKSCKQIFNVGKNEKIKRIENLKEDKCPVCGNCVFLQLKNHNTYEDNSNTKKSLGQHILADFFSCNKNTLSNPELVQQYMHNAAEVANASIVTENFHKFNPYGVSGAIIIQESHLTIHTWPEYGYAAVDIFTCGDSLRLWDALEYLKNKLECKQFDYNEISRGKIKVDGYQQGVVIHD